MENFVSSTHNAHFFLIWLVYKHIPGTLQYIGSSLNYLNYYLNYSSDASQVANNIEKQKLGKRLQFLIFCERDALSQVALGLFSEKEA